LRDQTFKLPMTWFLFYGLMMFTALKTVIYTCSAIRNGGLFTQTLIGNYFIAL